MEGKDSMRDNGKGIYNMGLVRKFGVMGKAIRAIIRGEGNMALGFIGGRIARVIRGIGFRAGFRARASMSIRMGGLIKGSLSII
jgi:hypothetical protein